MKDKPLEQQLSEIGNKELEKLREENTKLKKQIEKSKNWNSKRNYKKAIDLASQYPNQKGISLSKKGKTLEAIKEYESAIRINLDFKEAHGNLAGNLEDIGNLERAIESYKNATNISLNSKDSFSAPYNLIHIGDIYYKKEDFKKAVEFYEKALELNPSYCNVHSILSVTLYKQGDMKSAIKHCKKAIESSSYDCPALISMCRSFPEENCFLEAYETFIKIAMEVTGIGDTKQQMEELKKKETPDWLGK